MFDTNMQYVSHFTPSCFQSGAAMIFIILGYCIPTLGLCCPQFRDHRSSNTAHYSGEWRSQQFFVTHIISLWWHRPK